MSISPRDIWPSLPADRRSAILVDTPDARSLHVSNPRTVSGTCTVTGHL